LGHAVIEQFDCQQPHPFRNLPNTNSLDLRARAPSPIRKTTPAKNRQLSRHVSV
jgi:hypothetical protein